MTQAPQTIYPKCFMLDLETTTGDINTAGIRQIAVIDPDEPENSPTRIFHSHVIPQKEFRKKTTEEYIAQAPENHHPRKFKKIWPKLMQWIGGKTAKGQAVFFVAHNAYKWDMPILKKILRVIQGKLIAKREVYRQANKEPKVQKLNQLQQQFILPKHWGPFCSMYLARSLRIQGSLELTNLCHTLQVPTRVAHDALNDAEMLMGVFNQMLGDAPAKEVMEAALKNPAHPIQGAREVIESYIKTAEKVNDLFFVVYDFETTGLDTENDRVVQIGAYIPSTGAEFNEYVDPEMPIPEGAMKVHHITDAMVAGKDKFDLVWRRLLSTIKKQQPNETRLCLIGHNIRGYDNKMAASEMKRHQMWQELSEFNRCSFLDTLNLSRHLFANRFTGTSLPRKYSHKMQTLRVGFGIEEDNAHDALGDVRVNWKVLQVFTDGLRRSDVVKVIADNTYPVKPLGELIRAQGTFNPKDHIPAILAEVKRLEIEAKKQQEAERTNPHPSRKRTTPTRLGFDTIEDTSAQISPTDIGVSTLPSKKRGNRASVIIDDTAGERNLRKRSRDTRHGAANQLEARRKKAKHESDSDTPKLYDVEKPHQPSSQPMELVEEEAPDDFEVIYASEEY